MRQTIDRLALLPGLRILARATAAVVGAARDRCGNVMMIMAFALVPITFATGMVIDYSRAARLQTKLNAAADAAALAATTKPMLDKSMLAACNASRRMFLNALQHSKAGLTLDTGTNPTVTITETYASIASVTLTCPKLDATVPTIATLPISRTATVSYTGLSSNAFGGVLGSSSIEIGGSGTARSSIGQFVDIHMALDTSQSMGLAATDAAASALYTKTLQINGPNNGCAFGCHVYSASDGGYNASKTSNEDIAAAAGIKLRIDSLRTAATEMIDTASDAQGATQRYRFGLYRIGASTSTISSLSTNLAATKTTVQGLKLGPNTKDGIGDTHLQDMAKTMLGTITTHGDGVTQATAAAFLFIVTDGVQDIYTGGGNYSFDGANYNCEKYAWNHCMAVIKAADCAKLKQNNITVGIVYTTYLPVKADPTNPSSTALRHEYTGLVQDIAPNIKPALQACASSSKWFLEASDGPGIEAAMKLLLTQAMETARLTQ